MHKDILNVKTSRHRTIYPKIVVIDLRIYRYVFVNNYLAYGMHMWEREG